MVNLDSNGDLEHIYIIDWELCKAGLPGVEMGQFCAEIDLLRRFHPESRQAASNILSTFLGTYSRLARPSVEVARSTLVHWGGHLVVLTPRVPWGGKDKTRETVQDGVGMIVQGSTESVEGLRKSPVGELLPKE